MGPVASMLAGHDDVSYGTQTLLLAFSGHLAWFLRYRSNRIRTVRLPHP